jgi:hypothetical protein
MDYFELGAVNQSLLKKYLLPYAPRNKDSLFYREADKTYNIVGDIVDKKLTDGKWEDHYVVIDKMPSEIICSIVHWCFDQEKPFDEFHIWDAPDESLFDRRIKDTNKRAAAILEQGTEYYELLKEASKDNKKVVERSVAEHAEGMAYYLQSCFVTSRWLDDTDICQAMVVGNVQIGDTIIENCKGLIDRLKVSEDGTLTIMDIKTTSNGALDFKDTIKRYGYDFQLCWYRLLVQQNIIENRWDIEQPDKRMENLRLKQSSWLNPEGYFLVSSSKFPDYPLVYKIDAKNEETIETIKRAIISFQNTPSESVYTYDFEANNFVVNA